MRIVARPMAMMVAMEMRLLMLWWADVVNGCFGIVWLGW